MPQFDSLITCSMSRFLHHKALLNIHNISQFSFFMYHLALDILFPIVLLVPIRKAKICNAISYDAWHKRQLKSSSGTVYNVSISFFVLLHLFNKLFCSFVGTSGCSSDFILIFPNQFVWLAAICFTYCSYNIVKCDIYRVTNKHMIELTGWLFGWQNI